MRTSVQRVALLVAIAGVAIALGLGIALISERLGRHVPVRQAGGGYDGWAPDGGNPGQATSTPAPQALFAW
jgi:hypothetical protein